MRTQWKQRASNLLLGLGAVALTLYGLQAADAWWFQLRAARSLERVRAGGGGKAVPPSIVPPTSTYNIPVPIAGPTFDGEWIGSLEVRRLQISTMIVPGDQGRSLQRGVGHIRGTAIPGAAGNCGIAGHRDTFFRRLQHIELGDTIRITTPSAVRLYQVAWRRIVEPTAVDVLAPSDSSFLTLVTCYPFEYLGSAPQRYVVRAVETSEDGWNAPRSDPEFPAGEPLPERSASWLAASSAATTTTRASN